MTDAEIIARVRQGDREAYSLLVDRYRSAIYALAYHHLHHAEAGEERIGAQRQRRGPGPGRDVAQEVFVQGFLRLGQLRDPGRFVAWLRQITLNECRRWHRCRRPPALSEPAPASSLDVEGVVRRLAVEQALGCLSAATRLTLRLYYIEQLAVDPAALPPARRASLADAGRVIELYDNPEVPRHASSVRAHIDSEHSGLRLWFCEDETGRAVSACFTRYEASDLAYVDFVYTRPEARGQGWATACVAGISAELLREGKRPCFCYDTTKRGDLYRKVGARPYATWRYVETTPVE